MPYALKTKNYLEQAKGVVYIECAVVYNPLRAAVRTINPREHKLLEPEETFSMKVSGSIYGHVIYLCSHVTCMHLGCHVTCIYYYVICFCYHVINRC